MENKNIKYEIALCLMRLKLIYRYWPTVQVSLVVGTTHVKKQLHLFLSFYPLGNVVQVQADRHGNDGFDNRSIIDIEDDVTHK